MYQNTRSLHMTLSKKGTSKTHACIFHMFIEVFFKLINYIAFSHEFLLQSHQCEGGMGHLEILMWI